MKTICIGAPCFISVRPLLFGITRSPDKRVSLIYDEPGNLASALERGAMDAALIPSIEFLRGIGKYHVDGPAHIAKENSSSLLLIAKGELDTLQRVAVNEFSRTPVAVLRIVLDHLYKVMPDICVVKDVQENWQDSFDAVLLAGDQGLKQLYEKPFPEMKVHNLSQLWHSIASRPLVLSLWAYNDQHLGGKLKKILIASRNLGDQNLSLLSDGIAQTTEYDGQFLYQQFRKGWCYEMGLGEVEGLKTLEEYALQYQLIREKRIQDHTLVTDF